VLHALRGSETPRTLSFYGEKDAKGEDSLAKQQLNSGSFKPTPDD